MNYKMNFAVWNGAFAVPTDIVDNHIKLCGPLSLKLLLIILRNNGKPIAVSDLCIALNVAEEDVKDGMNYWVSCGMIQLESDIQLVNDQTIPLETKDLKMQPLPSEIKTIEVAPTKALERPKMSQEDITLVCTKNEQIIELIQEIQSMFGRTITRQENEVIATLHSYYGVSAEYILLISHYCFVNNRANFKYIEKTIASFLEKDIDTYAKAEIFIEKSKRNKTNVVVVQGMFGLLDRKLTTKEEQFIEDWFYKLQTDATMIKIAYEKTIENIGKISFPYINKILCDWHNKGIKKPEDIEKNNSSTTKTYKEKERKGSFTIDELENLINNEIL